MEWVLVMPFARAQDALSLNHRDHWRVKAERVKAWRDAAHVLAKAAKIPPCERIAVTLHYVPAQTRRRDPDNLVATYKPCIDGLVDAGVVPDDTELYVEREWPVIHRAAKLPPGRNGSRFLLRVVDLSGAHVAPTAVRVPTVGSR